MFCVWVQAAAHHVSSLQVLLSREASDCDLGWGHRVSLQRGIHGDCLGACWIVLVAPSFSWLF